MTNGGNCFEIPATAGIVIRRGLFFVKDEAQRVRARLNGGLRVGEIRDAANFDLRAHLRFYDFDLRLTLRFARNS
jgi:hypothetical protein